MKTVFILVVAFVLAIDATLHAGGGRGGGISGGHGSQASGGQFGNSRFGAGNRGVGASGYQQSESAGGHDRGHQEASFSQVTQGQKISDHDIGGGASHNSAGGRVGGFQNQMGGSNTHGSSFNRGGGAGGQIRG